MAIPQLGTLESVNLRDHWFDEALSFTPWLAAPENIGRLSKTLGLDLEVEATEVPVGPFRADIVARDLATDQRVIIENQLEKTNHDHLGKIITYASGLEATTMIWIARTFTEEHRRALDFLNEHVAPNLRLFGIEIQLWQIGDSLPAPLFKIISSPNDYATAAKQTDTAVSVAQNFYLDFWSGFRDYCTAHGTKLTLQKPLPRHGYTIRIGHSGFRLYLTASRQKRTIRCELYLRGAQALAAFKALQQLQGPIEQQLGPLDWEEMPVARSIGLSRPNTDIADHTTWPEAHRWLKEQAEGFYNVFSAHIKSLPDLDVNGTGLLDTGTPEMDEPEYTMEPQIDG